MWVLKEENFCTLFFIFFLLEKLPCLDLLLLDRNLNFTHEGRYRYHMQDGRVESKNLSDLGPTEAESILEQPRFRLLIMLI